MKRYACLLGVLALCLSFATGAYAQETRGAIEGVVKDASGGVLPGATVEARSPSLVGVQSTTSDANGAYRFPALAVGTYEVSATLAGFSPKKVADIQVTLGQTLKVDFALALAGVSESVQVTAESPIIDVKASAVTASVDAKTIDLIPKGRGLLSVLTQIPAAANESRGGGFMIDGASGSENRFVVDGVDRTNARSGAATAISGTEVVMQDFIDQVQVKQSGYNAEYRAALGGVVNAVTKSGGNTFHGGVATYYTNNDWRGDIRPTFRAVPSDGSKAETVYIPRDEGSQTDVAAQIGGPILRDRAWFFAGYAPQYYPSKRTVRWATPGTFPAVQTFDTNGNNIATNYNATGQISNALRARFTGNNETQKGALGLPNIQPDGSSTSSAATFNPRSPVYTEQFSNAYSGIIDWNATKSTFVQGTISYLSYGQGSTGGDYYHGSRRTFSTANVGLLDVPADLQHVSGYADNNSNSFAVADDYQRFNVDLNATKYVHAKGEHAIKIGGLYERIGNQVNSGQQAPNIAFNWGSPYVSPSGTTTTGKYGYFVVQRQYTGGDIHETNLSFFAQDQWTMNRKLTLNYGLRLEHEEIPSYNPNAPGVTFDWGSKIGPRVGFAYDFHGDGRMKAYGSYGVYYDTMKLEMPRGAWGGEKWISYYYTLDTANWPSIDCPDGFGANCNGGTFIESINFRHTSNEVGSLIGQVDPNIKPTRKHEYTAGLDREINTRMSVGVRYAHKGWDETIDDIGVCEKGSQVCGEVYNIGNPGKGINVYPIEGAPAVPPVLNVYDAVELVARKRYSNNWQATGSVVFSRLYGNYGGLASSDENGRQSPNVSRYYDSLFLSFDEKGQVTNGRLGTDRPVVFKVQGSYTMPWGTNLGANFFAESGLLQSSTVTFQGVPIYYKGRGDLGRTPMLSQTDLLVSHDFRVYGNVKLGVQANITNLFDQGTATRFVAGAYRDALAIPWNPSNHVADAFFQPGGIDVDAIQKARQPTSGRPSPTYGQPDQFQGERVIRVMGRIQF
jgi:outer membrane receptor protein involved in Fe transport